MISSAPKRDERLANDGQRAAHHTAVEVDGTAVGARVCTISPAGGLHARVFLDRGLDIGSCWFRGEPLSWLSPSGERGRGYADADEGWHRGWAGGLLTTCGLRHIGAPSATGGRHGRYSDRPAEQTHVRRLPHGEGIEVTGTVRDTDGLDRGLVLRRRLAFSVGSGSLDVRDVVTNEGPVPVAAPLLYHLNFGFPFLTEASRTTINGLSADSPFAPRFDAPAVVDDEIVALRARAGEASVHLTSPATGTRVTITWPSDELPRAYLWRRRMPGSYAHGIEPCNAALEPTSSDPWPILEPEESRSTGFQLHCGSIDHYAER